MTDFDKVCEFLSKMLGYDVNLVQSKELVIRFYSDGEIYSVYADD